MISHATSSDLAKATFNGVIDRCRRDLGLLMPWNPNIESGCLLAERSWSGFHLLNLSVVKLGFTSLLWAFSFGCGGLVGFLFWVQGGADIWSEPYTKMYLYA